MIIGSIFFVLTLIVVIATPFILKYQKQKMLGGKYGKSDKGDNEDTKKSKKKSRNLQDIWNVKDIQDGVIITDDDYYRMIIRIGSLDYYLMSEGEQTSVEDVLISLAISLNFPIQTFTTTELVDTKNSMTTMYNRLNEPLTDQMRSYIINSIEYLDEMMQNRSVHIRRSYIVISINEVESLQKATAELYRRAETILSQLSRCGIKCEMLNSEGITNLLYRVFNRSRTTNPSDLVAAGGTKLYKNMGGRVTFAEQTVQSEQSEETKEQAN
ncbi:MAG: hypothetical protein FH758_04080 [Firmicutes bacterium]|nr:hypothetical protein [Bacillota bacterium]